MERTKAMQAFQEFFGTEAEDVFSAAGRINVIGEHVDYCGGKVFPAALNLRCYIYARKTGGNTIRMAFRGIDGIVELDTNKLGNYKGLKIGKGNKFKTTLPPGYGQLFAILPNEITGVKTQLAPSVKAGSVCSVKVSADGAADKSVFRMEVYSPDGKLQPLYSKNQVSENKETVFSFQVPYNAEKGKWNLVFIHAASGKKSNRLVTVR